MFGADDQSQPHTGPVTSPTNNSHHNINDDIPAAGQMPADNGQPISDPSSVFPATPSDDPFGTATSQPQQQPVASAHTSTPHQQQQAHAPAGPSNEPSDLLGIKQQALQELSPLVQHLEQNPEEKFKTTMMMIQASDDQSLIPEAFDSAKNIQDDKARAQALLDIINEINYFTQNS